MVLGQKTLLIIKIQLYLIFLVAFITIIIFVPKFKELHYSLRLLHLQQRLKVVVHVGNIMMSGAKLLAGVVKIVMENVLISEKLPVVDAVLLSVVMEHRYQLDN